MNINAVLPVGSTFPISSPAPTSEASTGAVSFLDMANTALKDVSSAQSAASTSEAAFSAGVPGATLGKALVASDQAEVDWNATVAVRNEAVSAYQSIMNMQF
jgi:flagellar hook-basal body complex protein FliE